MTGSRAITWLVSVAAAVGVGYFVGSSRAPIREDPNRPVTPTAVAGASYTLEVQFDGGYLFDFRKSDGIPVHSLKAAPHPMDVQVVVGDSTEKRIRLKGYSLTYRPEGAAPMPTRPTIPPLDPNQHPCDRIADRTSPNNRLFIPNLSEAAQILGLQVRETFESLAVMQLAGGGDLRVEDLAGCVEYQRNRSTYGVAHSMASGHDGIRWTWPNVPGTKLQLHRQPLGGGSALTTEITPKGGRIALFVKSFDDLTPEERKKKAEELSTPHEVQHFLMHLAGAVHNGESVQSNQFRLWWNNGYDVSPSIDCPFSFVQ